MVETRHFGRLRAVVNHERREVVLSLDRVKDPTVKAEKLEAWARQALAPCEGYTWLKTF